MGQQRRDLLHRARAVAWQARQTLLPLHRSMTLRDYIAAERTPAFTRAHGRVAGFDVEYASSDGFLHSCAEIFRDEVYRFKARSPAPFIVDAGANIGLSVLYFKKLYPECRIIAFEPDPTMFELLTINVERSGLGGIELRNAAAWDRATTLTFYQEGSLAGSTEVDFTGSRQTCTVAAERLRDVLAGPFVDFLKLDIEGSENTVLPDIQDTLSNVGALFFEYHSVAGERQRLGELLGIVSAAGFRYSISATTGARLPFVEPKTDRFDLQMNVACYRG